MPEIIVIDTSSICDVRRKVPQNQQAAVYTALGVLVTSDKLVFPSQVFDELERIGDEKDPNDRPYHWAKKHRAYATRHGTDYAMVAQVLANPQVAKVVDPDKAGVEEADPYVLALAQALRADYAVVVLAEEIKDRPDKLSMSSACGLLRIPCLRMIPFLESQGIWP